MLYSEEKCYMPSIVKTLAVNWMLSQIDVICNTMSVLIIEKPI